MEDAQTWPQPEPDPEASPPPARGPFWGYSDLALFLGALLPAAAASGIVFFAITRLAPATTLPKAFPAITLQFLSYGFWFLALYAIFRLRYQRPFWESLNWSAPAGAIGRSLLLGPPLAIGVSAMAALMGEPQVEMPIRELLGDPMSIFLVGLFAVTLGPVCEELTFRGFLLPLLSRTFGTALGILIAALPFALLHGPQYGWSWRHVALIGLAGVAFGWERYRTGSTAAATAMHSTYNLTIFAGFLAMRSQGLS
ncbi:MAG: type II CAAX endopeptidase family protein [Bryobacteraceae bacterium]